METQNTTGTITGDLEKQKQDNRYKAYLFECGKIQKINDLNNLKRRCVSVELDIHNRLHSLYLIAMALHSRYNDIEHKHHLQCIIKRINRVLEVNYISGKIQLLHKKAQDKNNSLTEEVSGYEELLKILNQVCMYLQLFRSDICQIAYLNNEYITPDNIVHKKNNAL